MAPARRKSGSQGMNPALAGLLIVVAFLGVLLTLELTGKTDLGLRSLWSGGGEVHAANTTPVVLSQQALHPGRSARHPLKVDEGLQHGVLLLAPPLLFQRLELGLGAAPACLGG